MFMQMYPAYTYRDVLDEYAIVFYGMLHAGWRLMHRNYLMLSQISDLPGYTEKDRKIFYKNLEWASMHPSDILKSSGEGSSLADVKKIFS